mmetsp:Transcript_21593/g.39490  ORF Transcript_21593/g.39490 Transcript_21593/m.39490 type:complete len:334 (+) Transcript_21593:85-1086(+)
MFSDLVKEKLKKLDVYRKVPADLTEPTLSGAIVSIVAASVMILLFFSELSEFLHVNTQSEMFVDVNRGGEKLTINIDVTFPRFPCGIMSLDAQDIIGTHIINVEGSMKKQRISADGADLGDEDLLSGGSKFDSDGIKRQLDRKEGCRLHGFIRVNKVPGNFHISSHAFHEHIHTVTGGDFGRLDLSHKISHLSFGDNADLSNIRTSFSEGVLSPLDGFSKMKTQGVAHSLSYEYYIKVVPTTYTTLEWQEYFVHQFTANTNEYTSHGLPAVFFRYDLSPVTVKFSQEKESLFHFLVQVCAIIGGVFTVSGLVEGAIHTSMASVLKKSRQGKLG